MRKSTVNKRMMQAGFTLLEFLMVLALFFILMGVVYTVYDRASSRTNISEAASEILEIVTAAKDYKLLHGNYYASGSTSQAITPGDLCSATGYNELKGHLCTSINKDKNPVGPWDGSSYTTTGSTATSLVINITGLDSGSANDLRDRLNSVADKGCTADGVSTSCTFN